MIPRFLFHGAVLVLGAASLMLGSAAAQDAADEPKEVRFVFYNLKNWLKQPRTVNGERVANASKPEDEKKALVAMLARIRPEILGICEIGDMSDVNDFKNRMSGVGIDYEHVHWVDSPDPARHLALLSQYPIVSTNSQSDLEYEIEGTKEAVIKLPLWRGILDATVQINDDYQLRCVGAHLKSKREVDEADQALMRRNEAHLLRQHIEKIYDEDPNTNLLVYGDFNDTRNEPPIKAIQGKFGTDRYLWSLKLEDRDGYRWTHHWEFADIYARIDFIFVSPGLTREINRDKSFIYYRDDWFTASDHRPLVAAIRPVNLDDK